MLSERTDIFLWHHSVCLLLLLILFVVVRIVLAAETKKKKKSSWITSVAAVVKVTLSEATVTLGWWRTSTTKIFHITRSHCLSAHGFVCLVAQQRFWGGWVYGATCDLVGERWWKINMGNWSAFFSLSLPLFCYLIYLQSIHDVFVLTSIWDKDVTRSSTSSRCCGFQQGNRRAQRAALKWFISVRCKTSGFHTETLRSHLLSSTVSACAYRGRLLCSCNYEPLLWLDCWFTDSNCNWINASAKWM